MPVVLEAASASGKQKFLDRVRTVLRANRYSLRTEDSYVQWIRRFILFHQKRHPQDMGGPEVAAFLSHLAVEESVAASTQNQALSALLFLYQQVLERDLPFLGEVERARVSRHVPVVLTREETMTVLNAMDGETGLMARALYGGGLRLMECLRLRVKDVDFGYGQVIVREGKGGKDRVTMLPQKLREPLRLHLEKVRAIHAEDLAEGFGEVFLPDALDRKFPNAAKEWIWQWVFPAGKRSTDPRSGMIRRHHYGEKNLQHAVKGAVLRAGVHKKASPHTFRHSFATICWKRGMTFGRCRNYSGTRM